LLRGLEGLLIILLKAVGWVIEVIYPILLEILEGIWLVELRLGL